MFPFLNSTQKLVALISVESIGASNENSFMLLDDAGSKLLVEKLDYPGGYALFNTVLNKEMLRVDYRDSEVLDVHNLYTNQTFEVQLLRNNNNVVKGAIVIGGALQKDFTIVMKNGKAQYLNCSFEASAFVRKQQLAIAA
jgi:hypothetical protein